MRFKKITQSQWYQESSRLTGLTGQKFSTNVVVSLGLLMALVIASCVMR